MTVVSLAAKREQTRLNEAQNAMKNETQLIENA